MAFLLKQCLTISQKSRLHYLFTEKILSGTNSNKNISSLFQSRHHATECKEIKSDKTTNELKQIYYGPLTKQIRTIKVFTILSSTTGILAQPVLYSKFQELGINGLVLAAVSFYTFFVLVSPLLIHFVTKRYVTRIEFDPETEKYTAYTYTLLLRQNKIEFTPEDVKVPTINGMFTTHLIKGFPLFMDARYFDEPSYYAKIMGYDKPIDFSIDSDSEETKK